MRQAHSLAFAITFAALVFACASGEPAARIDGSTTPDGSSNGDASSSFDGAMSVDAGSSQSDASQNTDGGVSSDASMVHDDCNPLTQMGCTAPTSECIVETPVGGAGASCVMPDPNAVGLGAACVGGQCLPMLACVRVTTSSAVCVHVCDINNGGAGCDSLGTDYDCRSRIADSNWGFCSKLGPMCDPVSQSPCPIDQACGPVLRTTGMYEFRCKASGTQGDNQPCAGTSGDCQRGYVCVSAGMNMSPICKKFCAMNMQCPSPEQCTGAVSSPLMFRFCTM
jgi:hypothetical protein